MREATPLQSGLEQRTCQRCGAKYDLETFLTLGDIPKCTACGGRVKPDVVLYEEGLDGDVIRVPSWRGDVECVNDIAEEVLRIYGYDTIRPTLFSAQVKTGRFSPRQTYRHRLADLLCGDHAVFVNGQISHLIALLLKKDQRIVYRCMLDTGGNDMPSAAAFGISRAEQRQIV